MGKTRGSRNLIQQQLDGIALGRQQGFTLDQLAAQFNVTKSAISRALHRFRIRGGAIVKKQPGRPRITNCLVDRNIVRASRDDPRRSASVISAIISTSSCPVPSIRTIQRLQQAGLHGRRPAKKPFINVKNRAKRVAWAKAHMGWTRTEWSQVLWSDESKYNLFGSDGVKYVRHPVGSRFDPKYQTPTMKHSGGSVIVWGCFSGRGIGPLRRIQGIMDRYQYEDILEKTMRPFALGSMGRAFVFQQDNDPKHRSKDILNWFRHRRVTLLEWPSQSPDLNIIEPLWDTLERMLVGTTAKNADEKFAQLADAWSRIPQSTIDALIDSMLRRCQAVINSKSFPTKY